MGDPKLLTPEIDAAVAAGIPVITVDADAPSSKRLFFVGTNNYQAGEMGGEAVAKQLNGKGNVVVFLTAGQANMEERLNGYRSAFEQYPQLKIAAIIDLKGDPRVAFDKTKEILEKGKPTVDAFVSMEAQSAKEVAEVLGRNKTKKVVISMDALPATLEGIENGGITATIAQKPFTMGYSGLRLIADLYLYKLPSLSLDFARNPNSPLPRFVDTGVAMIDKSNLSAYREARRPEQVKFKVIAVLSCDSSDRPGASVRARDSSSAPPAPPRPPFSSCGSWPWRTSAGVELHFDIRRDAVVLHVPLALADCRSRNCGAVTMPPSISGGAPPIPPGRPRCACRPACPTLACWKFHGMASPPEPANSLMIITFGPKMAACGWCGRWPSRVGARLSSGRVQHLDDVIGQLAAAVEALVDDRAPACPTCAK